MWSELDEVVSRGRHVGVEQVMDRFGVQERNKDGQMAVGLVERMDITVEKTSFQKRQEDRLHMEARSTQVDTSCRGETRSCNISIVLFHEFTIKIN